MKNLYEDVVFGPAKFNKVKRRITQAGIQFLRDQLIGRPVPKQSKSAHGNTGRAIEKMVLQLFEPKCRNGNTSKGPDILEYQLDIKSHNATAVSTNSTTIGHSTWYDLVNKSYTQSDVYKKMQGHIDIWYDNNACIITDVNVYYFDYDYLQEELTASYNELQSIVSKRGLQALYNGEELDYDIIYEDTYTISASPKSLFSLDIRDSGVNFRISRKNMRRLTSGSKSSDALGANFTFV